MTPRVSWQQQAAGLRVPCQLHHRPMHQGGSAATLAAAGRMALAKGLGIFQINGVNYLYFFGVPTMLSADTSADTPATTTTPAAPRRKTNRRAKTTAAPMEPVSAAPAVEPVTEAPAPEPVTVVAEQPLQATKPPKAAKAPKVAKLDKATETKPKHKLVRDSFTLPKADFDLIAVLKQRALERQRPAKKSELLRAGLQALARLPATDLVAALEQLAPLKAGRPPKAG